MQNTHFNRVILYFDGASKGNPWGPAGCGFRLVQMDAYGADSYVIFEGQRYLGYNVSNNEAEYHGLIKGLEFMRENGFSADRTYVRGDSEIVVNQLNGYYQVRSERLEPLYDEVQDLLGEYFCGIYRISHIRRGSNFRSDALANDAICEEQDWDEVHASVL